MSNPFEREKPKGDLFFKGKVWNANEKGQDAGTGSRPILVGPDYIWFSKTLSVPIRWSVELIPVGPGFFLKWRNEINQKDEGVFFCIRTFFGYDLKKREELIQAVARAKDSASSSAKDSASELEIIKAKGCQKCGNINAELYDFVLTSSIGLTWQKRTERFYLCKEHAGKSFRRFFWRNLFFGFLGITGILGQGNMQNTKDLYERKLLSTGEYRLYSILSFSPLIILALLLTLALLLGT